MKLFSKRHERALCDETLQVVLPERLKGRIWKELQAANETIRKTTETGWNYDVDILSEVDQTLKRLYGADEFHIWNEIEANTVESTSLEALVRAGYYHYQTLDVIEVWWAELWPERRVVFQQAINSAFEDEGCPWKLADGHFFKVDSEFLEQHILATVHTLLGTDGFKGAMDEFMEARNDLISGDYKDSIHKACKSMESVLKVILGVAQGTASSLLRRLQKEKAFDDISAENQNILIDHVLMSLPNLRNKFSGHGQGGEVVKVPQRYASLAVHLAAVFNAFFIQQHLERIRPAKEQKPLMSAASQDLDDTIPF